MMSDISVDLHPEAQTNKKIKLEQLISTCNTRQEEHFRGKKGVKRQKSEHHFGILA